MASVDRRGQQKKKGGSHLGITSRAKDYRQGRKRKRVKLSGVQFVWRWMLHVLPPGFVRVRYDGLLANVDRTARLSRCRQLLAAGGTVTPCRAAKKGFPLASRGTGPAVKYAWGCELR